MRRRLEMDIESCGDCPWYEYDRDYYTHWCTNNKKDVQLNKTDPIPDWCPLPFEVLA